MCVVASDPSINVSAAGVASVTAEEGTRGTARGYGTGVTGHPARRHSRTVDTKVGSVEVGSRNTGGVDCGGGAVDC